MQYVAKGDVPQCLSESCPPGPPCRVSRHCSLPACRARRLQKAPCRKAVERVHPEGDGTAEWPGCRKKGMLSQGLTHSPPCTPAPLTWLAVMPTIPRADSAFTTFGSRHGRMMACTSRSALRLHFLPCRHSARRGLLLVWNMPYIYAIYLPWI